MPNHLIGRRSIRLKGFDYTQDGAYFITICSYGRVKLFGKIDQGEFRLSQCGEIIRQQWLKIGESRSNISLDEFIIMPNHMHGIIVIRNPNLQSSSSSSKQESFGRPIRGSIPTIMRCFKSYMTREVSKMEGNSSQVWQRGYYEHVIRNDSDLNDIRFYIRNNPVEWDKDQYWS